MLSIFKLFLPKLLNLVIKSKNITLIGVVTSLLVISSIIFYFIKNDIVVIGKKKENMVEILVRSEVVDNILKNKLSELKHIGCTSIALFQYHNGIFLKSGNALLKTTITNLVTINDDYKSNWEISNLQGVNLSIFGKDFLKLVKNKIYQFDYDDIDLSYSIKSRLYFTKSESVVAILITNGKSEPIGNMSVYFSKKITNIDKKHFEKLAEVISFELNKI